MISDRSRVRGIWREMWRRCNDPNIKNYGGYGARGIRVCPRWGSFDAFYKDMGPAPTRKHTLDRIDNNKGYYKSNCQWATWKQQNRNRSNGAYWEFEGERKLIVEWAEIFDCDYKLLHTRLNRGWDFKRAVSASPIGPYKFKDNV